MEGLELKQIVGDIKNLDPDSYSNGDIIFERNSGSTFIKSDSRFNRIEDSFISKTELINKICDKDFCPYFKSDISCRCDDSCLLRQLELI